MMTTRQEILSAIGLGSIWGTTWKDYEQLIINTGQRSTCLISADADPSEKPPRADESKTPEEEAEKLPDDGQRVENLPEEDEDPDPSASKEGSKEENKK